MKPTSVGRDRGGDRPPRTYRTRGLATLVIALLVLLVAAFLFRRAYEQRRAALERAEKLGGVRSLVEERHNLASPKQQAPSGPSGITEFVPGAQPRR